MTHADRPQAPGYLANLMARLFHEVSRPGLAPLGIRPEQLPVVVQFWFGEVGTRDSLAASLEMDAVDVDALLATLVEDGLIGRMRDPSAPLALTDKAIAARDDAMAAARRANDAARSELDEAEMAQFMGLMNRVIDALQRTKAGQ